MNKQEIEYQESEHWPVRRNGRDNRLLPGFCAGMGAGAAIMLAFLATGYPKIGYICPVAGALIGALAQHWMGKMGRKQK